MSGTTSNYLKRNITVPAGPLPEFAVRNHIHKLAFFGSVLRPEFGPESDVDILADFEPDHVPRLFKLVDLEDHLATIIGRTVDLRTPEARSRYFRDEVIESASIAYAA